jgi:oligopeptide/dipeptide ABC transporter ATP-binding protein
MGQEGGNVALVSQSEAVPSSGEAPGGDTGTKGSDKGANAIGDPILEARGISVEFRTRAGTAHVLNDMGFVCHRGQLIGLVGESGSGKSVLAGVLVNRVRRPGRITGGQTMFGGQDLLKLTEKELRPIRGRQIGMIVSQAHTSLNPLICVGDQIANIYRSHYDVSRKEAKARALAALAATGINDPDKRCESLPHELSGGMAKRIIIAAALVCEPSFLIADEPSSGLDVTIQVQVLDSMMELVRQKTTAGLLLMTRDLGIIAHYCTNVIVTYAGQAVEAAPVERFYEGPVHPYSSLLLACASLDLHKRYVLAKAGPPPDKYDLPQGCLFFDRCLVADDVCRQAPPPLSDVGPDHLVRCWKAGELS